MTSDEQDWYRIRREHEKVEVSIRMLKRWEVFSTSFSISKTKCKCGEEHYEVIIYDEGFEEIDRLCPCLYFMRWHIFSEQHPEIGEPPEDLITECAV